MHSQKFLRQRKFMVILPVIVAFLLTIIFVALGGGRMKQTVISRPQGLNMKLPDAHFKKEKEKNKLGFYEQTQRDSFKIRQSLREDPLAYRMDEHQELENIFKNTSKKYDDTTEEKVMSKLVLLKEKLREPPIEKKPEVTKSQDITRLENMMAAINTKNEVNPEIRQLSEVMDKILAAEHPGKWQDTMQKIKPFALPVALTSDSTGQNGFYGLADNNTEEKHNGIEAVIDEEQTLVSGAVVKLRLLQDIYIRGSRIGENELIYGVSSLNNERLKITVTSIRSEESIFPVSLDVYDMDGLEGIYVPGSINRDVTKQSADNLVSGMNLATLDPSIGAQAATAGIQAAKTLISKKIKLVKLTVGPGYRVLLKDNVQK